MKVLLTGANGFIGRYLLAGLVDAGHQVVPAVRDPAAMDWALPTPASIKIDFNRDVDPEDWLPRLQGIDAVINCAGILHARPGQSIQAIHALAPKALFAACQTAGVRRVIQISAISADTSAGTAYAQTKLEADSFLMATDLDWIVVRPSLVYAEGAFGGTALLRALACVPFVLPLVGRGEQLFQPIHVDDLTAAVCRLLEDPSINREVIEPAGPDSLTFRQILVDLRRWLGVKPGRQIEIPVGLISIFARLGDVIGGPVNTTALRQLLHGNAGAPEKFTATVGIVPRHWNDALLARPAQVQDRWHARLYFLRPALRWSLAVLWLASGFVGLSQPASITGPILAPFDLSGQAAMVTVWLFSIIDIAVGLALVARWRPRLIGLIQIALIGIFTVGLSVTHSGLWLDPFGPLLKNIPILVAVITLAAIENDR
jgi:uncharacterized protein YbjT (DUF2867 family)